MEEARLYQQEIDKRLEEADRYFDRPDTDLFSKEGLRHIGAVIKDVELLAQRAMILSGKPRTVEVVGEAAAFDLFWQACLCYRQSVAAESIAGLLYSLVEAERTHIKLDALKQLFADVFHDAEHQRQELRKIGSSVEHLVRSAKKVT